MTKKPMVLKIEMIVSNENPLEQGWTPEQADKLHDALKAFIAESQTIWGYAHSEFYTQLVSEIEGMKEIARMNRLTAPEPHGLSA